MDNPARDSLFISHASPEDNAFTLWIGAKLAALGYTVFADILRLKGGDDWERILEDAIRNRATKFLLVGTPHGVQKQGVRNELNIATQVGRRLKDSNFVVPLKLAQFDAPFNAVHAQYIDFSKSWAVGLGELLTLLADLKVPRSTTNDHVELWKGVQLKEAKSVSAVSERLISNWLEIVRMPEVIRFCDFKAGISVGAAQKAIQESPIPIVPFNRGFLTFEALPLLQEYFGPNLPLEVVAEQKTRDFLDTGWVDLRIEPRDSRPKFTDLARRSLDRFFERKGLRSFELSSGRLAWWSTAASATMSRWKFGWADGPSGSRQLVGHSRKRAFHWHYGVSCWARTAPMPHIRVAGRVIFTSDGSELLGNARRMHRARRSFCKSWHNDKWRDLLLAFWARLSDGGDSIEIPMGDSVGLQLRLPPLIFNAPFSISTTDAENESEDDDIDDDDDEPNSDEERDGDSDSEGLDDQ